MSYPTAPIPSDPSGIQYERAIERGEAKQAAIASRQAKLIDDLTDVHGNPRTQDKEALGLWNTIEEALFVGRGDQALKALATTYHQSAAPADFATLVIDTINEVTWNEAEKEIEEEARAPKGPED